MEPLFKRSDGAVETPTGLFAVTPVAISGTTPEGKSWFEYRAHMLSDVVRVEWEKGASMIIIEAAIAKSLVANGYATEVSEEVLDEYAAAYDTWLAANPAPAPSHPRKPVVKPAPALPAVVTPNQAAAADEAAQAEALVKLQEESAALAKAEQDRIAAEAADDTKSATNVGAPAPTPFVKPDWATPKKPKG